MTIDQAEIQKKINYVSSGLRMKYKAEVTVSISGMYSPSVITVAFSSIPYTCSIMLYHVEDEHITKEELLFHAEHLINFDLEHRIKRGNNND